MERIGRLFANASQHLHITHDFYLPPLYEPRFISSRIQFISFFCNLYHLVVILRCLDRSSQRVGEAV